MARGDRFIVQVHYNNGARLPDALTVGFVRTDVPGQTLWPRYRFRRAP